MTCVLIAGEIAAGKSSVARALAMTLPAELISVRRALAHVLSVSDSDRETLQRDGAALDRRTNGRWLVQYLQSRMADESLVVDSMRTVRQTTPVLEWVPGAILVYLDATVATRRNRFALSARDDAVKRSMTFDAADASPNRA